jgi:hypothetical protein
MYESKHLNAHRQGTKCYYTQSLMEWGEVLNFRAHGSEHAEVQPQCHHNHCRPTAPSAHSPTAITLTADQLRHPPTQCHHTHCRPTAPSGHPVPSHSLPTNCAIRPLSAITLTADQLRHSPAHPVPSHSLPTNCAIRPPSAITLTADQLCHTPTHPVRSEEHTSELQSR